MKKIFLMAMVCLLVAGSAAAQQKKAKSNTRAYALEGSYQKLIAMSAFDIVMSDTASRAWVTVPEAVHKQVALGVENGVLSVSLRGKTVLKERPRLVLPHNAELCDIELLGAASLQCGKLSVESARVYLSGASTFRGKIDTKEMSIELQEASHLDAIVNTDNISLTLRSASEVILRGRCLIKADLLVSEASTLDALRFEVKRMEGKIEGGSQAQLWCTERMHVPISGSSHVIYVGHPVVVNCPTSDVSTLKHK